MCAVSKVKIVNAEPTTISSKELKTGQLAVITDIGQSGADCNISKIVQKRGDGYLSIINEDTGEYMDTLTGKYIVRPLKLVKLELAYA